jgi:hypothetical protein
MCTPLPLPLKRPLPTTTITILHFTTFYSVHTPLTGSTSLLFCRTLSLVSPCAFLRFAYLPPFFAFKFLLDTFGLSYLGLAYNVRPLNDPLNIRMGFNTNLGPISINLFVSVRAFLTALWTDFSSNVFEIIHVINKRFTFWMSFGCPKHLR